MVFVSRGPVPPGRYLDWKIRLFFVAAVLLLVGIARDIGPLVLLSIGVLAAAFLLRFLEPRAPPHEEEEDEPEASGPD
jgi:hypothetical protein